MRNTSTSILLVVVANYDRLSSIVVVLCRILLLHLLDLLFYVFDKDFDLSYHILFIGALLSAEIHMAMLARITSVHVTL